MHMCFCQILPKSLPCLSRYKLIRTFASLFSLLTPLSPLLSFFSIFSFKGGNDIVIKSLLEGWWRTKWGNVCPSFLLVLVWFLFSFFLHLDLWLIWSLFLCMVRALTFQMSASFPRAIYFKKSILISENVFHMLTEHSDWLGKKLDQCLATVYPQIYFHPSWDDSDCRLSGQAPVQAGLVMTGL